MKQISKPFQFLEKETIHFIENNELSVRWSNLENNSCWISNKTAQLCGLTQESLIETPKLWEEIIFPQDKMIYEKAREKCLAGVPADVEYRVVHVDKQARWIRDRANPVKDENGKVISISSILDDVTDRQRMVSQLNESEERFHDLIESAPNAIIVHQEGEIAYANPLAQRTLGSSLKGKRILEFVHPESIELFNHQLERVKYGEKVNITQYRMVKFDGSEIVSEGTAQKVIFNGESAIMTVGIDITKEVEAEKTINYLAFHDSLTGLPNRYCLTEQLTKELADGANNLKSGALLVVNLDRFKVINDKLSYSTGDYLLKEVAKRLRIAVSDAGFLFRPGGDEFIIILTETENHTAAMVAEQIVHSFSEPFTIQHEEIFISASVGISLFPEDGHNADAILKKAEIAMDDAKKSGGKLYKFFSDHKDEGVEVPFKIEMDLYKAVENNQFILHYQPKVHLTTGEIIGLEALIRWNHPELGMISPGTFIPIAEKTGLIIPIGRWALYEACKQNHLWHQKGYEKVVSVNLSIKQFRQTNMVETIAEVLRQTKLKPQFLEVEITESMTADIDYTLKTLKELKSLGVKISMDDFGTGFSSLNYLKEFPIDTLKIDQSFVRELHTNPKDKTIIKTIISMAHNLSLNVVAEGIESKEQLVFLQQHLCNDGQGFFFSKPQTANEIEKNFTKIERLAKEFGQPHSIDHNRWTEAFLRKAKKEVEEIDQLQEDIFSLKGKISKSLKRKLRGEKVYNRY